MASFDSVAVIGAGAWGTALALTAHRAGRRVSLWAREADLRAEMAARRENTQFLAGIALPRDMALPESPAAAAEADAVLIAAPAQHVRTTLAGLKGVLKPGQPVVICAKGLEQKTDRLMTEVLAEALPEAMVAILSGPSFAEDVARGLPTAVTLAAADVTLAERLAAALATQTFRPYASGDPTGVAVGGAVKNVLAIACGIVEGRGLGRSAHAALITRGFAELTRFAIALGGRAETVAGLCGLGDLVLTCSSPQSRNMTVGLALGRGQTLEEALAGKTSVAEGVASAPAVRALAAKLGVETPISNAVAAILAGEVGVSEAIIGLLSRPLTTEGRY